VDVDTIARQLLPFNRFLGEKKSNEAGAIVASWVRYIAHCIVARLNKGLLDYNGNSQYVFFCNISLFSPHVNLVSEFFLATYTLMLKRKKKKGWWVIMRKTNKCPSLVLRKNSS
jgi:hypothetical protein